MSPFTLGKQERLSGKRLIELLFNDGKSLYVPPLRITWMWAEDEGSCPARVLFSVSKRSFPRAVDRNKIKRLLREGYRRQKAELHDFLMRSNRRCLIAFIFAGKQIPDAANLENKTIQALQRLVKEMDHQSIPGKEKHEIR